MNSDLDAADVAVSKHVRETALKERWNESPAVSFNNITKLGRPVPMHTGEAYDNPGTALVPPMMLEDFTMTSISPAV